MNSGYIDINPPSARIKEKTKGAEMSKLPKLPYRLVPDDPDTLRQWIEEMPEKEAKIYKRNLELIGVIVPPIKPKLHLEHYLQFFFATIFIVAIIIGIIAYFIYGIESNTTIYLRGLIVSPIGIYYVFKSVKKIREIQIYRKEIRENAD